MIKIIINNIEIEVNKNKTILQACTQIGLEIPCFCYHEKLKIAGNCRMCLVEVENAKGPVVSCAMPVMPNMKIFTDTPRIKTARNGVMEFLLINHPLDCPICDQGGECDLQDQSMIFGNDRTRYFDKKRAVEDKECGPLIKTVMTRCIQCTRCIRFATEIACVEDLGLLGRGTTIEVGTYISKVFNSELSGNIIDLCPVGALTSKPYAFKARSWELEKVETIDVMDALGSNIRVDYNNTKVLRVLPRINEDINSEWITDKTRFAYDGLQKQRLVQPLLKKNKKFESISWTQAFNIITKKINTLNNTKNLGVIVGHLADAEAMITLKDLFNKLGTSNIEIRQNLENFKADLRTNYLFNSSIAEINKSDVCLLVATNPRFEASLLNIRLHTSNINLSVIGSKVNLTYDYNYLGNNSETLLNIAEGTHSYSKVLKKAKNPLIIVGVSLLEQTDGNSIYTIVESLVKYSKLQTNLWNGINYLQIGASKVAGLDLGLTSGINANFNNLEILYLLNADDIDSKFIKKNTFIIYQGHTGDKSAMLADLILPSATSIEKNSLYINLEGRIQETRRIFLPPQLAREDWTILKGLAKVLNISLNYNTLEGVRQRLADISINFLNRQTLENSYYNNYIYSSVLKNFESKKHFTNKKKLYKTNYSSFVKNFYFTNVISRASLIMAKCSKEIVL